MSDKIINNIDNFRVKSISYSEKGTIFVIFIFCSYIFSLILKNMSNDVRKYRFLGIFDTCIVVYNWSISLDNLFGQNRIQEGKTLFSLSPLLAYFPTNLRKLSKNLKMIRGWELIVQYSKPDNLLGGVRFIMGLLSHLLLLIVFQNNNLLFSSMASLYNLCLLIVTK